MRLELFFVCCILQSIQGFHYSKVPSTEPDVHENMIVKNEDGAPNMAGGLRAPKGLAPFQCSLQSYGEHFCGCAVINSQFVLTASHCLLTSSPEEVQIMVGSNDLRSGGTYYDAERLIPNEQYNTPKYANDIALVKVKGSFQFNEDVQPIELEDQEIPVGSEVFLTGWGRLQAEGRTPNRLQYVKFHTLKMDICKNTSGVGPFVQDSHICTFGVKGIGACEYDSGGPLWTDNKKLVGIVNFGIPCGVGKPDVFAKISSFVDWIANHTSM